MKLSADTGDAFELVVLGYEYPDITEDRWDSNWLVIGGSMTTLDGSWRFVDPCVTTFELEELADWLDTLRNGDSECEFTEPNLSFSYVRHPEPVLRVRCAHESAPPSLEPAQKLAGVVLEFPLPEATAASASADIRNILLEYPIRGGAA